jgi:hypothetical protein
LHKEKTSGSQKAGIAYAIAVRTGSFAPSFQDEMKKVWTSERYASVWNIAREEYFDKGASFEDAIPGLSEQLGVKLEVVLYPFIKAQGISRKLVKRMWIAHQRSLLAQQRARDLIATAGTSEWDKLVNKSRWQKWWQNWQDRRIAKQQARDIMRLFP